MDYSFFEQLPDDESDPFDSDDDEDYIPDENELETEDEYDSDDSDVEYIEQETREAAVLEPNVLLLSKDKKIEYSTEPLSLSRRTVSSSHSFSNRQGPTTFAASQCTDTLSTFLLFIQPIEKIIIDMTNLFGVRCYKEQWVPVDVITIHAYFGLLLLAGVYRSYGECLTELWNNQHGRPIFAACMSLDRFKQINRCLRFDDKQTRDSVRDKLSPIRNVFDKWVQRLKLLYCPGDYLTVDEQLLPFRGRSPFTQYIPSKPAKYGIKLWVCADAETFYAYNMQVYVGRDRNCGVEVNQGERVVLDMTEGLNGRNVTTDNFFTSHHLATELKKRQMTLVGTMRKNRKEIPPILVDMKKKPLHHTTFVFDHNLHACMLSYVPKKRRFVTLLSTYHSTVHIAVADKDKKPDIIKFYNQTKKGVDVLDKLVGTYRCKRKVNRWPMALFCNMLDVSASNAFIIFMALNPEWNASKKLIRRRLFLIEVGQSLCYPYIEQRKSMPRDSNALAIVSNIQTTRTNENLGNPTTSSSSESSSITIQHAPVTKKRARCGLCPYSKTGNLHSVRCDKCLKYICPSHRFAFCTNCAHSV